MMIEIRKAEKNEIKQFISLLHQVKEEMEHPEWFALDPDEVVMNLFEQGRMKIWLAMDRDVVAGAFSIVIPNLEEYNLGYELNMNNEQLMRVVHMDAAAVRQQYRGQGLQKRLMQEAEQEIRKIPNRILLCTVHPDNFASLNNLLKQDYSKMKLLNKYDSIRYIMKKELL